MDGDGTGISLVVAIAENGVIGRDNGLPWRLPADLQHFKRTTMGKPILMGRKTFESIGRPLPGRRNIVVSRNEQYRAEGCETVSSIDAALELAANEREIMIIGGASFYEQLLERADRLYVTRIHASVEGDAYFPQVDWSRWREIERSDHQPDERNEHAYSFVIYARV